MPDDRYAGWRHGGALLCRRSCWHTDWRGDESAAAWKRAACELYSRKKRHGDIGGTSGQRTAHAIDSAESDITYEELTTTLGELILALPIPEGHAVPSSWVASSDEGVVLLLSFNVVADVDADIADFIQLLQDELDFDLTEAEGAVGGGRVLLAGPVEIDGQEVMFNIEVGNYDGFFFIAIYAAE